MFNLQLQSNACVGYDAEEQVTCHNNLRHQSEKIKTFVLLASLVFHFD